MRRTLVLIFTILYIFTTTYSFAAPLKLNYDGKTYSYTGKTCKIYLNGELVNPSVPPVIFNNSTLVPAREVFEKLGAKVSWDDSNKKVSVSLNDSKVVLKINSKNAFVNDKTLVMETAPKNINGKAMVPVRFVAEQLNLKVGWNADNNSITIDKLPSNPVSFTHSNTLKEDVVTISLNYDNNYKVSRPSLYKIVVDFPNTKLTNVPKNIDAKGTCVKNVKVDNYKDASKGYAAARVVIDVTTDANFKVEEKNKQVVLHVRNYSFLTPAKSKTEVKAVNISDETFKDVNETVYSTANLNIRKGPGTGYEKIGEIKADKAVNRTGIGDNNWSRVVYNGVTGYCSSDYLTLNNDEEKTLEGKIKKYLGKKINSVSVIYYDLTSGEKLTINKDKKYLAASTVKVQLNMLTYNRAQQGKLKLTDTIKYQSKFYEGGTGILQSQNKSKPIQIQTLLDYSIKYSDNIATNMLMSLFGGSVNMRKEVNSTFGINMDTSKNYITAEGEYVILKNLYNNRSNTNYAHLIDVMKNTIFHDRIDKYVPRNIVAHKIGNYGSYVNDVGIVFTDDPYIFVMYTNGTSNASETIAKVAKIAYDYNIAK